MKLDKKALQAVANRVARNQGKNVVPIVNEKGGVEITNQVGEVPKPIANEFYDALINLLRSQLYRDGVDISAFSDKLVPFKDSKTWYNGLIQIIGKDLKIPTDGYQKELAFDNIFNPVDRTISAIYGQDSFKKNVREKIDRPIALRSLNDGDAVEFINNIQKKQNDDLAVQLFNDFLDYYKLVIITYSTIEIDTTTNREQRIVKAEKDAIEYLKLPQDVWNETGWVYTRPASGLLIVRDPFINNEIEVYLSANVFNPSYIQTGLDLVKLPIYSDDVKIYSIVQDKDKVKFQITLDEMASQVLDGFQIAYVTRMFYGMYHVPWLGGIAIVEVGTIVPSDPTATFSPLTPTDPSDVGLSDGQISGNVSISNFTDSGEARLNPASGSNPITLSDGGNSLSFTNLPAGSYTIEAYDGNTLVDASDDVVLTDPE